MLLAPLSWIFFIIVVIRRIFQTKINPSSSLKVPVIVIGNINIGGTGKTPLVIAIARYLKDAGYYSDVEKLKEIFDYSFNEWKDFN